MMGFLNGICNQSIIIIMIKLVDTPRIGLDIAPTDARLGQRLFGSSLIHRLIILLNDESVVERVDLDYV